MTVEVPKGAVIEALGQRATIRNILYQHVYVCDRDVENMADIEFIDTNGKYRHWQSWSDGGKLIIDDEHYYEFKREV